ncbi:MAG: discoidin domain-containing protein, partial [Bacteroidaceae bacterium]|nr:discoidin domain-containing protein [Bacteroidaceae bacterium]
PYIRWSTDGKEWNKIESVDATPTVPVGYFIFINETEQGVKNFSLDESLFCITTAAQAFPVSVTLPEGSIYENHTADMMVDGDYSTYTCLNRNQIAQDKYLLDLGAEIVLHDVRLCMGTVNGDYPLKGRIQYSVNGSTWANLKVKGTDNYNWTIDEAQNVRYNDDMVYCDFDGAGL